MTRLSESGFEQIAAIIFTLFRTLPAMGHGSGSQPEAFRLSQVIQTGLRDQYASVSSLRLGSQTLTTIGRMAAFGRSMFQSTFLTHRMTSNFVHQGTAALGTGT